MGLLFIPESASSEALRMLCVLFYLLKKYLFVFVCAGSSLLGAGFLDLWRVGAAL